MMAEVPIDRGWAWMVVLGAHLIFFFLIGGFKSLGIFFVEFQSVFGGSRALTALLMGLVSGGMSILSPFSTVLGAKYTMRCVAFVGASLCVIGTVLSFFANSLMFLILVFGLLMGIGYGFLMSPAMVMVNSYFDKRRSLASGLALAGGSMGTLLIPQLITALIGVFAYKGAMLIYAALMMHMIVGAALLRPTTYYSEAKSKRLQNTKKSIAKSLTFKKEEPEVIVKKEEEHRLDLTDSGLIYDEMFQSENSTKRIRTDSIKSESDVKDLKTQWSVEQRLSRGNNSTDRISNSSDAKNTDLSDVKQISGNFESGDILDYSLPFYTSGGSMFFKPYHQAKFSSTGSVNFMPNHASTPYMPTTEKLKRNAKDMCCAKYVCACCFGRNKTSDSPPLFEWKLLGNLLFLSYVIGICLGNCGYVNTFLFFPPMAEDIGLDKSKQALLLSIAGVCDLFGRIFFGWFADLGFIKRHYLMSLMIGMASAITFTCANIPCFESYVVLAVSIGLFGGGYISLFPVVLSDYIGFQRMPQGFGITIMFMGLSNMGIPALLGYIRDSYGSYIPVYMFCGSLMAVCALLFAMESCIRRLEERRTRNQLEQLEWDDEVFMSTDEPGPIQ